MPKIYEEWLSSNEQWNRSTWVLQLQQSSEFTRLGARRWMTYKQICQKYESSDVADSIVAEKRGNKQLASQQIKRRPDVPWRDDAKLHVQFVLWEGIR